MAIATKPKPKTTHHKKRTAQHHRQTKHYVKHYWPYLPIALIIVTGFVLNGFLNHRVNVLGAKADLSQTTLLQATNEDRQQNQTASLSLNPQLQTAAQAKANDMVTKNYWSHKTPSGQEPWGFVTTAGYQYQTAGENLAYGFNSADSIMNAWLQSPEHRANLLNTNYTEVGFGVAQSTDYMDGGPQTVVVAMYALPASAGSTVPIAVSAPSTAAPVSRVQTLAGSPISAFLVGVVGTLAVVAVLFRHGFAWRRMLNRGEMFVIQHPKFDIVLVSVAVIAVLLNHTSGFIH